MSDLRISPIAYFLLREDNRHISFSYRCQICTSTSCDISVEILISANSHIYSMPERNTHVKVRRNLYFHAAYILYVLIVVPIRYQSLGFIGEGYVNAANRLWSPTLSRAISLIARLAGWATIRETGYRLPSSSSRKRGLGSNSLSLWYGTRGQDYP